MVRDKLLQAAALLRKHDIDCWVTFVRESGLLADPMLAYVCGEEVTWHSAFIVGRSGETTAVVGEGDRQTIEDLGAYQHVIGYATDFREPLAAALRALAPRSIALNFSTASEVADGLTHGMYLTMLEVLGEVGLADRVVSAEAIVSTLRGCKSPSELEAMREAIAQTLGILDRARSVTRPGASEWDVAAAVQQDARARGLDFAWSPASCPLVFTGPDALGSHARPTARLIEAGHLLYIDFGVKVREYCADLQRTYFVGAASDVPPAVRRGFGVLVESIERARLALRPGTCGMDVDAAARGFIVASGYEEYRHGLGHQVGRFAHDGFALLGPPWPKYGRKVVVPIEAGMVFTIEPRLFVPGHGHVSIEEMVLVRDDGAEYLSPPQRELICLDPRKER